MGGEGGFMNLEFRLRGGNGRMWKKIASKGKKRKYGSGCEGISGDFGLCF